MNKNVLVVKLLKSKFGRAKVERNYLTIKRKNRKKKKKRTVKNKEDRSWSPNMSKGKDTWKNFPLITHKKDQIVCRINRTSNPKICVEPQIGPE